MDLRLPVSVFQTRLAAGTEDQRRGQAESPVRTLGVFQALAAAGTENQGGSQVASPPRTLSLST